MVRKKRRIARTDNKSVIERISPDMAKMIRDIKGKCYLKGVRVPSTKEITQKMVRSMRKEEIFNDFFLKR